MRFISGERLRFIVAGTANTLITYLLYLILLPFAGYFWSFSFSFVIGIFFSFFVYTLYVFRAQLVWKKIVQYPAIYLIQYIAGLLLLTALIDYLGMDARLAPFANVLLLLPVSFLINRWFITPQEY